MTSSSVPVTPRITLTRSRSKSRSGAVAGVVRAPAGRPAGRAAAWCRSLRGRSGAMPNSSGGKSTGVEEAAAAGVGPVGRLRVGVEVVLGPPVGRRHLGDRIDAGRGCWPSSARGRRPRETGSPCRRWPPERVARNRPNSSLSLSSVDAGRVDATVRSSERSRGRSAMLRVDQSLLNLVEFQRRQSRDARRAARRPGRSSIRPRVRAPRPRTGCSARPSPPGDSPAARGTSPRPSR